VPTNRLISGFPAPPVTTTTNYPLGVGLPTPSIFRQLSRNQAFLQSPASVIDYSTGSTRCLVNHIMTLPHRFPSGMSAASSDTIGQWKFQSSPPYTGYGLPLSPESAPITAIPGGKVIVVVAPARAPTTFAIPVPVRCRERFDGSVFFRSPAHQRLFRQPCSQFWQRRVRSFKRARSRQTGRRNLFQQLLDQGKASSRRGQ